MTSLRKPMLVITSFLALTSMAQAANVFMLQFGSFQSADEAQQHLSDLQNKHPGALSRLQSGVRTVTLPPDNLTVYRTQAGPLASRADAQSVCSQLASNGDECYVVESAPSVAQASVSIPSTAAAIAPATTASVIAQGNALNANAAALSAKAEPAATQAAAVATSPAISAGSEVSPAQAAAAEDSVRLALDNAVRQQDSGVSMATTAPEQPSFWDRINPFTTTTQSTKPAVSASATAVSAPVEMVDTTAAPAASGASAATEASVTAMEVAPAAIGGIALSKQNATATSDAPAPLGEIPASSVATPSIASAAPNFPLPPPPAPLVGAAVSKPVDVAPVPPAAIAAASSPALSSMTIDPSLPVSSAPLPAAKVHVEEAKRVPMAMAAEPVAPAPQAPLPTATPALPAFPAAPVAAPNPSFAQIPPVDLHPSATKGQRTLWAQIGHFSSTQSALAFWANFRQMHPDFPVVRVRTTSAIAAQRRGVAQTSLRVGPFARPEFIAALCNSLTSPGAEPSETMHCGSVSDTGVADTVQGAPTPGLLTDTRYRR